MTAPIEPPPMSRANAVSYAIALPAALVALIFIPAGSIAWLPGWIFLGVLVAAWGISAIVLWRVNPAIYRARSRFQPGTKRWDRILLKLMLPIMVAILPVGALEAGRFGPSLPIWAVLLGYAAVVIGIAGTGWAQAVNPFFEPGVRIQQERQQRVIDGGPYRLVRHPGYTSAILMFVGMALALGSRWALIPAVVASALLALRTSWEDRLLQAELPGYQDFVRRVRFRLLPGVW
jgi:protein-S-isoprenylcysteine O-methyltransferase Ste14